MEKIYSKKTIANDKKYEPLPPAPLPPLTKDEQRSDTDSGHSSIHCEKEYVDKRDEKPIKKQAGKLKVARGNAENNQIEQLAHPKNFNVIGHKELPAAQIEMKPAGAALQVIRRKDAILRRKNMQRRNTIDINRSDMLKASNGQFEYGFGTAKSTNCLDKVGTRDSYEFGAAMNGSSMPGK